MNIYDIFRWFETKLDHISDICMYVYIYTHVLGINFFFPLPHGTIQDLYRSAHQLSPQEWRERSERIEEPWSASGLRQGWHHPKVLEQLQDQTWQIRVLLDIKQGLGSACFGCVFCILNGVCCYRFFFEREHVDLTANQRWQMTVWDWGRLELKPKQLFGFMMIQTKSCFEPTGTSI